MITPTPPRSPRAVTVLAPLGSGFVEFSVRLQLPGAATSPDPHASSWFVTHGLGRPAGGTYTEVQIEPDAGPNAAPLPEHVVDAVVRQVAVELYSDRWAFLYRPDQYADAIRRHGMARREVVVVEGIEVQ